MCCCHIPVCYKLISDQLVLVECNQPKLWRHLDKIVSNHLWQMSKLPMRNILTSKVKWASVIGKVLSDLIQNCQLHPKKTDSVKSEKETFFWYLNSNWPEMSTFSIILIFPLLGEGLTATALHRPFHVQSLIKSWGKQDNEKVFT